MREFHSIELASWLQGQKVNFVLRQKQSTTFRQKRQKFQPLSSISVHPGIQQFYTNINLTQKAGFGRFNLAVYWKRKYKGKQEDEARASNPGGYLPDAMLHAVFTNQSKRLKNCGSDL